MCRYTAVFLKEVLNSSTEQSWQLVAGRPLTKENEGTKEGRFGFRTSNGLFFDHCWLQSIDLIVDLTADQFGDRQVIITSVDDPRYNANLQETDLARDIAKLSHHPETWLREWQEQHQVKTDCCRPEQVGDLVES